MAKARGEEKRKSGDGKAGRGQTLEIGGILRLRLLEFEEEVGLMPHQREPAAGKGQGGRSIYDRKSPTPAGMAERFPEEIAVMRRLGKPTNSSFAIEFPPYRVACLPYFYYDGFHALLYVEKEREFLAAWSEGETERHPSHHPVTVRRGAADLEAFLDLAIPAARG